MSDMGRRIGVIGAGVMGAAHVRTLAEVDGAEVVAVADADMVRAEAAAGAAPGSRVVGDPLELIAATDVDAVVIASPDATHEAFALACVQAGKPVLCEKPLAATGEASLRVVQAEAALGRRVVQVGFMRRYDPGYAAVKRQLDDGRLGGALLVHCAHRNASVPPTYTSDMLITSSLPHEIDVARWLLGEEVARATVYRPRQTTHASNGIQDPQFVILEMAGGVLVDVEVFANAGYGYDIQCQVVGETGTVALPPQVAPGFVERFGPAYLEELQTWVDRQGDGGPTGPSAWDGYAAAAVADACLASLAGGEAVAVELAERPALYG
ncbi:MAG: myo-inositol 2-dehydrogenase / D-chiro-inositol 1-dehydrogenase [Solirubrobacteraceae bacterium]|nr:myo-inositol 2-dehydrogenase / D-chiro-inositol 1-dehydrogenase [Solirubrobacteraceae bacterium]